ncbi:MAG: DUF3021 domain-containing protein [Oscillospiraceae bacterium]|nr:DUF3021 domain-containing protein [Oscillospiraceae bacterium]
MKKIIAEFFRRGLVACGLGPLVLAALYLVLQQLGQVQTLTVNEVCIGIVSLSLLAFIAGGMNVIYQTKRLPLMAAVLIHGSVLYICYLATYLVNDWLRQGTGPILIFSLIFIIGYLAIWVVIYSITLRNTKKLNKMLSETRQDP